MGTSCAPFRANLTLSVYEFEWFAKQIFALKPWHLKKRDTLWRLSFCTRYIDDLWNPLVSNSAFQSMTANMYPEWLQPGLEHTGESVPYLDIRIGCTIVDGKAQWYSDLYDKKEDLVLKGLKLNKFPHPDSRLSSRCKYGVITSQLHRYSVACSSLTRFLTPATKLYSTYLKKGYERRTVDKYFRSFMQRHMPACRPTVVKQRYDSSRRQ